LLHQKNDSTNRLLALSDGVFAIALTLLVLDIGLPDTIIHAPPDRLLRELLQLVPHIIAYIISFLIIGIYWASHNFIFRYVKRYDKAFFWLNLLLLLTVAFLPFPTSVLARNDNIVSVVFYAGCLTIGQALEAALWLYASRGNRLIARDLDSRFITYTTTTYLIEPFIFLVSIGLAFVNIRLAQYFWITSALVNVLVIRIF